MQRKIRSRHLQLLAAAVGSVLPTVASAQTSQWIGGSSDWNTPSNWSPAGVPSARATVNVTSTLGAAQTITYDYDGTAQTINLVTVTLTGGSGAASEILSMSGNTLASTQEDVGGSLNSPTGGVGTFNQSGGANTVGASGLIVGFKTNDQGYYLAAAAFPQVQSKLLVLMGPDSSTRAGARTAQIPSLLA